MSVKTTLARKAVKTTAKHTAHGTASKLKHKPFRTTTLLAAGALIGGAIGWLVGRSGGGDSLPDPVAQAPAPPSVVATNNSTEQTSETGATT
jgi:hypothetical protein